MSRHLVRSCLLAPLSGLLLLACGGHSEAVLVPEEPLGTQQAELCSGLSVTSLSILGASTYQGELAASGSWAVSTSANAVRLEYYIGGVLYASEERPGSSGSWNFSSSGIACGTRTFLVKAFPMVIDSAGVRTTCWGSVTSRSQSVTEPCPGGTWQLLSMENCYDLFMASCYTHNFSPSCPSNPQGTACPTVGASCWRVRSASVVEEYWCQ